MGIDWVHTANIVTMMYRANGKAVPSMVFDIEDVHREQWKMYRGSACRSGTVSNVSRIFQERGQDDLELHLLCDAITAAFSNQCNQSGSFEHHQSIPLISWQTIWSSALVCLDFHMIPLPRTQEQVFLQLHGPTRALRQGNYPSRSCSDTWMGFRKISHMVICALQSTVDIAE